MLVKNYVGNNYLFIANDEIQFYVNNSDYFCKKKVWWKKMFFRTNCALICFYNITLRCLDF